MQPPVRKPHNKKNKNIAYTIKRWLARRANPNKSSAVLTLRTSRYFSDAGGGFEESIVISGKEGGRPVPGGVWI